MNSILSQFPHHNCRKLWHNGSVCVKQQSGFYHFFEVDGLIKPRLETLPNNNGFVFVKQRNEFYRFFEVDGLIKPRLETLPKNNGLNA